jgi:endonuclease/exonuclease/phosphatase family metal-dependent hydrolase
MSWFCHLISRAARIFLPGACCVSLHLHAQTSVVIQTNARVRLITANLTSGNNFRYETPGLNIMKGLKPDIVAIQEFTYASPNGLGVNTPAALREMIDTTFGTNFVYFRESGYALPNGVISRYPILGSGSWDDVQLADRGFAWALLDIPGTNDLYIVSVHLHSGGGASSRNIEATNLKSLIQSNFPANAWLIVAGDMNTDSRSEAAIATFKTFLSDNPIPTDLNGDPDTNVPRNRPYDYILPGFSVTNLLAPIVLPSRTLANGLVFVSTNYTPLSDVPPVQFGDSIASGMQHMAVVKDFQIPYFVTNYITVPAPVLTIESANVLRWHGMSNATYTVQARTNLNFTNWIAIGTASSTTTNFSFTNQSAVQSQFYRVVYP